MKNFPNSKLASNAAKVATVLFVLMIFLQVLLATGILPITMAWGGKEPVLTSSLRITHIVSAGLMGFFAHIIRRRAGIVGNAPVSTFIKIFSWLITAFLAMDTFAILSETSIGEKILFGPIALFLAVSSFVVSSSKPET